MAQKVLARACFERLHPNTLQCVLGAHLEGEVALEDCECSFHAALRAQRPGPKAPAADRRG